MSTRISNRALCDGRRGVACLALVVALALALPLAAHAAKSRAKSPADQADKADADDKDDDTPESKLPPVLRQALAEKEAEVTAARREAIKLIESYLHDSPHSKEQAEAMYKLAELYWEESKAVYLDKMGRYQAAVSACHSDRAECPKVPRRPPTVDLEQAQAVYLKLIDGYPKFRKIDTVIYLYSFSLRDQGKIGESIKYFQMILDRFPRSRYIADAWMAIAEYRFYEQ
jgi:cellulose synthase operon protein C